MHPNCTQSVPNNIALSTLGPRQTLEIASEFPRFRGEGEGAPENERNAAKFPPMRPVILNPLFADARVLSGIGPRIEKLLSKMLGSEGRPPRVRDLAFHLPANVIDRRYSPKLVDAEPGRIVTVTVN